MTQTQFGKQNTNDERQQTYSYYQSPHMRQAPPPPQVNYVSSPVVSGKPVNKVAYVLLALFLGGFGAHNFYAGKTGLGILFLLFCWTFVPSVIALIQAILALCKKADVNGFIVIGS